MMKTKHIQHIYWRAGFGINPDELTRLSQKSNTKIVNELFEKSSSFTPLTIDTSEFDKVLNTTTKISKEQRKQLLKNSNKKMLVFNSVWIDRLTNSNELLRERMTLFWANHFVCQDRNIVHMQQYNNTLRKHALGNFGDFIKESKA